MDHTSIINYLIKKNKYTSYLEIGVRNKNDNFNLIRIKNKTGVDPDPRAEATFCLTSDAFFEQNAKTFDIVFIDGLHRDFAFKNDIINSLKVLNIGGTIVCHDCLPNSYDEQVQEPIPNTAWTGDVWKGMAHFRMTEENLKIHVIDTDYGCGVVRPGKQTLFKNKHNEEINYDFFVKYRNDLMNVITVEEFLKLY